MKSADKPGSVENDHSSRPAVARRLQPPTRRLERATLQATWADIKDPAAQAKVRTSQSAQRYKAALDVAKRNVKKLSDAGVRIAMGTDTGPVGRFQGYFELMEIEMMVDAGMTPTQALAAATRVAAACHGLQSEVGTLEAKHWADFMVLDADPLANIANIRKINAVYIAGNKVVR